MTFKYPLLDDAFSKQDIKEESKNLNSIWLSLTLLIKYKFINKKNNK